MLPAGPESAAWRQASHPAEAPGAGGATGVPAGSRGRRCPQAAVALSSWLSGPRRG